MRVLTWIGGSALVSGCLGFIYLSLALVAEYFGYEWPIVPFVGLMILMIILGCIFGICMVVSYIFDLDWI